LSTLPMTTVMVTHRLPGFHCWPGAPKAVEYLAFPHRHLFLIIVAWRVGHPDRDVEFHTAQGWIRELYQPNHDFGARSCEMIAKDIRDGLVGRGFKSPAWVEVHEDEENGSRVEFA